MQVQLVKDCTGPNPLFDRSRKPHKTENNPEVIFPEGSILEGGREVILHCIGNEPNAVPFDDEAKTAFIEYQTRRSQKEKLINGEGVSP